MDKELKEVLIDIAKLQVEEIELLRQILKELKKGN